MDIIESQDFGYPEIPMWQCKDCNVWMEGNEFDYDNEEEHSIRGYLILSCPECDRMVDVRGYLEEIKI